MLVLLLVFLVKTALHGVLDWYDLMQRMTLSGADANGNVTRV